MKVKVINKNLNDLQEKKFRPVGSIFETDEERGQFLIKNNAVEMVEEIEKTKVETIEAKSKKKKPSKK